MGEAELLIKFQELAIDHYRASEAGDDEVANLCVDEIGRIICRLWNEQGQHKEALKGIAELSSSDNPAIAIKAITYSLEFYPEVADQLHRLRRCKSIIGVWAEYTMSRWKNGQQKILKEMLGL